MTGRRISIPGYSVKDGKPVPRAHRLSVSKKIAQRKSKKQRVVRRAPG